MQKLDLNEMKIVAAGRGRPDPARTPASGSKGSRGDDRNGGGSSSGGGTHCSGSISFDRQGNLSGFSYTCRATD